MRARDCQRSGTEICCTARGAMASTTLTCNCRFLAGVCSRVNRSRRATGFHFRAARLRIRARRRMWSLSRNERGCLHRESRCVRGYSPIHNRSLIAATAVPFRKRCADTPLRTGAYWFEAVCVLSWPLGEHRRLSKMGASFGRVQATHSQVADRQGSRELRLENDQRNDVLLALHERLRDPIHGVASALLARHLQDGERRHVDLWIPAAVFHQRFCNLLRSLQAEVRNEVAMDRMWKVDVEHDARKVSAIVEEQVEVADIAAVIEVCNQPIILFLRGVCLEAMDLAIERRPNKLRPLARGRRAIFFPRCKSL